MGKMLIILIALFTVVFVAITLSIQERTNDGTEILAENLDELRAKDLGAFALNHAMRQYRNGTVTTSQVPLIAVDDTTTAPYSLPISSFIVLDGDGEINSIEYSFIDSAGIKEYLRLETVVTFGNTDPRTSEAIFSISSGRHASEVAYWDFDEGSGVDSDDDNPNDHDATLVNVDTTSVWATGQDGTGSAIHLDGTNDRADLESGVQTTYDDELTICTWAKLDPSFLDWGNLICEQTNSGGWPIVWTLRARVFDIWFFKTCKYAFDIVSDSGVEEVSIEKNSWQMDIYDWHFIVGSYDGTYSETEAEISIQIYDEGFRETEIVDKWSRRDTSNVVSIGGRETNVWWFGMFTCIDATLDEMSMYSEALSQDDIDDIYNGNFVESNNIIYWRE